MSLLQDMGMDESYFSIASLANESDEAAYRQAQTPQACLDALELMRQVMYGYDPSAARIERLFEVAQLERG